MKIHEIVVEQQLDEGIGAVVDNVLNKIFGPPGEPMQPGEFGRKVGKIPVSPTTQELEEIVAQYLFKAKIDQEAEELAWRNKTTVEKINHYLVKLAAVLFTYIDPERLGRAIGNVIIIIIKAIINALLKRS